MPTIKSKIKLSGRGIHSGEVVNIVIKPSKENGIFFRRVDMPKSGLISATFDNVGETKMRNTTIGNVSGAHVKTIEHLMAALFISGVDSAVIEIDGPETPIMDGSAIDFYNAIIAAGVSGRDKMRRIIVKKEVIVRANDMIKMLPFWTRVKVRFMNFVMRRRVDGFEKLSPTKNDMLNITATIVYPEKIIGSQTYSYSFDGKNANNFVKNIARARTFGKYSEWEYLKAHGMARGADETNVIALNTTGDGTLNKTYYPDEFVRHKIVDALGDMFTAGGFVVGNLESYKGSHAMNNAILRKLFENPDNYEIID